MLSQIDNPLSFVKHKLSLMDWHMVVAVCLVSVIGVTLLYSAAGGSWDPWASRQFLRFTFALPLMMAIAITSPRFFLRFAYEFYALALLLLVAVEITGSIGMGAQRWIDLGIITIQPSEIMKIAVILAIARYFHGLSLEQIQSFKMLVPPVVMLGVPVILVLMQPDLGTAVLLILGGAAVFWLSGTKAWLFGAAIAVAIVAAPISFQFLHDYQKDRIYTFLDPLHDPHGAGYNVIQSKIALGSGGFAGKGLLQGTQGQLMFIPEKHTDFIFVVLAEEFGLLGAVTLLGLYTYIVVRGLRAALSCRNNFGRMAGAGLACMLFLYVFINTAMVSGMVPVVGVPLPLVSYGGTSMLTAVIGIGLMLSIGVHREMRIPRSEDM